MTGCIPMRRFPIGRFLGGQYGDDGIQGRWLAPTNIFLEFAPSGFAAMPSLRRAQQLSAAARRRPARAVRGSRNRGARFAFVVRSMQLEFLKPARMDDLLEIVTKPLEIRGASITLGQEVRRGDVLLLEAKVKVAFISGGQARPIPKPLRTAMKADQA